MQIDRKTINSITIPSFFLVSMWLIHLYAYFSGVSLVFLGVYPVSLKGLWGILSMPMVHANFEHLLANSSPFFLLASALFYFYPRIALRVFCLTWLLTGSFVWLAGRESYHIGASGLVYGYASFLVLAGMLSKERALSAIALLVWFLYGGMVWGIVPLKEEVSWEGHLWGMLVGLLQAYFFRKDYLPAPQVPEQLIDDDFTYYSSTSGSTVRYTFTPKKERE